MIFALPSTTSLCHPFYSFPVKQLEIRLTVFVGHSEKKKITYLIFTVMMSILFLSVLVSQHVNLDALLIAERRRLFLQTRVPQSKQEARPYNCVTLV